MPAFLTADWMAFTAVWMELRSCVRSPVADGAVFCCVSTHRVNVIALTSKAGPCWDIFEFFDFQFTLESKMASRALSWLRGTDRAKVVGISNSCYIIRVNELAFSCVFCDRTVILISNFVGTYHFGLCVGLTIKLTHYVGNINCSSWHRILIS